jgi:hypothetical protein
MTRPLSFRPSLTVKEQLYKKAQSLGITTSELLDFVVQSHFESPPNPELPDQLEGPDLKLFLFGAFGQALRPIMSILIKKVKEIEKLKLNRIDPTEHSNRVFVIILEMEQRIQDFDRTCNKICQ